MKQRIITAKQAKALDKKALAMFGIPTLLLMENAGRVVSDEVLKVLKNQQAKIAIFCGTGNNGGDGFCTARHLLAAGIKPDLYLVGKIDDVKNEASVNLNIFLKLKQRVREVNLGNVCFIKEKIKKYSLIIDALLGVGIRGRVRPVYQELINIVNSSGVIVISVDIPSGLDATTGKVLGSSIEADKTITFIAKKKGIISKVGKKYCGEVLVRNIGVPL